MGPVQGVSRVGAASTAALRAAAGIGGPDGASRVAAAARAAVSAAGSSSAGAAQGSVVSTPFAVALERAGGAGAGPGAFRVGEVLEDLQRQVRDAQVHRSHAERKNLEHRRAAWFLRHLVNANLDGGGSHVSASVPRALPEPQPPRGLLGPAVGEIAGLLGP
jgi:hypothetical protein